MANPFGQLRVLRLLLALLELGAEPIVQARRPKCQSDRRLRKEARWHQREMEALSTK